LSTEDRADEQVLNQAIWQSVKGADSAMPPPRTNGGAGEREDDGDGD